MSAYSLLFLICEVNIKRLIKPAAPKASHPSSVFLIAVRARSHANLATLTDIHIRSDFLEAAMTGPVWVYTLNKVSYSFPVVKALSYKVQVGDYYV